MRRSPKYWVGFYISLVGFLFVWEVVRDVLNGSILFRVIFSDYRLYLGIVISALGFLLQNAGLKSKT
jgi:hypothetical protein